MAEFAEIFKTLRKNKGLTQERVAEDFGVSPQAISRWETGASCPDTVLLPMIAAHFDITVDELLGIRKAIKMQKIMYFQFRWQESAEDINRYLDDGWTIKEMQTHPLGGGQHPEGVVILEKTVYDK